MGTLSFNTSGPNSYGWRLGNQMFQYASLFGIAKKNEMSPCFNISRTYLDKCFKLGGVEDKVVTDLDGEIHDPSMEYNGNFFKLKNNLNINLNGYFQIPEYFNHCRNDIKIEFTFVKDIMSKACTQLPEGVLVSVHVRRADYLNIPEHHTNLQVEYYERAMKNFEGYSPVIFSDDIEWCKKNLNHLADVVYFSEHPPDDGNDGVYVDLCKMSLCNGHIIANSSFSWWGAYLGEGRTVAPKKWFGPKGPQEYQDIYLEDWILHD